MLSDHREEEERTLSTRCLLHQHPPKSSFGSAFEVWTPTRQEDIEKDEEQRFHFKLGKDIERK